LRMRVSMSAIGSFTIVFSSGYSCNSLHKAAAYF
jgi:hypothetical protein